MRLFRGTQQEWTARPVPLRRGRSLRVEPLEPRQMLTVPVPLDGWQSAIFDDGVTGTLDFEFSRDVATVSPTGEPVGPNQPRYGRDQLVTDGAEWSLVWDANFRNAEFVGSGWDHDGTTPLAALFDRTGKTLYFLRGEDAAVHAVVSYRAHDGDLLRGEVPEYRFLPSHGIVHEGLVVFQTERSRWEGGRWVTEGVTFIYTQDYGATMHRVAQVGGGFDVPAISGGVSDGKPRAQRWSFSNAFPERSTEDVLGAWFPWADYLHKSGSPKGGQIGLFRARRPAVGEPWVVEPNVLVYERWEPADVGGFHAHSAGMFLDGLASFWGDVDYRNHVVRHVASDLEDYTTATWTHNAEFQGAWSPPYAQVYRIANQGGSTAPAPVHGEFLLAGDEQAELVMNVKAPTLRADFNGDGKVDGHDLMKLLRGFGTAAGASRANGDADGDGDVDRHDRAIWQSELGRDVSELAPVITNLKGSFPGPQTGAHYAPRSSLWIQHLRGRGYVVNEYNVRIGHADAYHFSADGRTWASILEFGERPFLYGDQILVVSRGDVYAADIPVRQEVRSPLVLNPGGTNLAGTEWTTLQPPADGNGIRRVEFDGALYVYADSGKPIFPQPTAPPPTAPGMPIWEVTSSSPVSTDVGTYQIGELASVGDQRHWLTAWHYSLNGEGIDPRIQLGSSSGVGSVWVTNNEWVPGNAIATPSSTSAVTQQPVKLMSGVHPGPRRWLMAVESFVQGSAPTYPLEPGATGGHELASLGGFAAEDEWTVGLSFALPQVTAFNSWWDAAATNTYRPIATIYEDADSYVAIGFSRTSFAGTLWIDVYVDGTKLGLLTIPWVYFDVQDRADLVISGTATTIGATLQLPRDGFGIQSRSGIGPVGIRPQQVLLSNASQTEVSPLEWFAVQVHPRVALSMAEREAFVSSAEFFSQLDVAAGEVQPVDSAALAAFPFIHSTVDRTPGPAVRGRADGADVLRAVLQDGRVGDYVSAREVGLERHSSEPHAKKLRSPLDVLLPLIEGSERTRGTQLISGERAALLDEVLTELGGLTSPRNVAR